MPGAPNNKACLAQAFLFGVSGGSNMPFDKQRSCLDGRQAAPQG